MQRRQITMADGRYLIFYTFAEGAPTTTAAPADTPARTAEPAPPAQPQAEAERHV